MPVTSSIFFRGEISNFLKMCIISYYRKERGNCRICWTTANAADFAISGKVAMGIIKSCCGYGADGKGTHFDCVQIPSASKKTPAANTNGYIENNMGFCGEMGLVSINEGVISATICCKCCECLYSYHIC